MTYFHTWVDGRDKICRRYLKGYRVSFSFEGFCGADIIVTPLKDSISSDTIQTHLNAGALLIQVKNGRDFDASVIDQRLFESLLRMNTWESFQHQNGLLLTGEFKIVRGHLFINGDRTSLTEKAYEGAWNSWLARGGVVYPPIPTAQLQQFIDTLAHKHFVKDPLVQAPPSRKRKKFKPTKRFTKNMGFAQKLRLAQSGIDEHDLRHILINFDGLSHKTVEGIWKLFDDKGLDKNMGNFIELVKMGMLTDVKGIGAVIEKKVKKQLGY